MKTSLIIVTGFSGTGKTDVGELVADLLGWKHLDTDQAIVALSGQSVADIFSQHGEKRFRALEREVVEKACSEERLVVSVGGGAMEDPSLRSIVIASGWVVCLEASVETIVNRLTKKDGTGVKNNERPLLDVDEPVGRIRSLKKTRQWAYAMSNWTIHTDALTTVQVAQEIVRGWWLVGPTTQKRNKGGCATREGLPTEAAVMVHTPSSTYPVYVDWGILEAQLGLRVRTVNPVAKAYLISDETVFPLHGRVAQRSLEAAGVRCQVLVVPAGERTKQLETARELYQLLAEGRAERSDVIIAVGGGMVGDLAGYVAATYLRGMPVVQVPTSLAAMVDASIGGKVAVNLSKGKNLVGAFHQPQFVLADVNCLNTMPDRELREGWAEAIKHGVILDKHLFELFENNIKRLIALEPGVTTEVIRRSVQIKARVVTQDEKETMGIRTLLNFGHTIGHGLEAASGYNEYLHGEAVAIGMVGSSRLGHEMGLTPGGVNERLKKLLDAFNLPTSFQRHGVEEVLEAMTRDKKMVGGTVSWVLLEDIGQAVICANVPELLVQNVLVSLTKPGRSVDKKK